MGRRGLVRFDHPAHQNPQVLKASEYNLSPQAHTSSGNPADDYEVFDSNRRVVGRIMLHPQAPKDQPWFWTITAREIPSSVHNHGYSATREQAMADFKTRWLMGLSKTD
jgi:hypothetical protein